MNTLQAWIDEQDYLKKQQGSLYEGNGKVVNEDVFSEHFGVR